MKQLFWTLLKWPKKIPLNDKAAVAQVATLSAADESIGAMIADAIMRVGKDGVVTVEEGKGLQVEIEYKDGMEFDRGIRFCILCNKSRKNDRRSR